MDKENEIEFGENAISVWALVILPLAIPAVYTYSVPQHLVELALPGYRVEVVFGKTKKYAGLIRELVYKEPPFKTKPILNILDDSPLIFEEQL